MTVKKEFQGFSHHRYKNNPLEEAFAKVWQEQNDTSVPGKTVSTLAYLLSNEQYRPTEPSERDHLVAATVIQWLGSPVGQNFLTETLGIPIHHDYKFQDDDGHEEDV